MSPIFLKEGKTIRDDDLRQIERYFSGHKPSGPHDAAFPYMQVLADKKHYNLKQIHYVIKRNGWELFTDKSFLNFWERPLQFDIPENMTLRIGRYFDPHLRGDLRKLIVECFSRKRAFLDDLERGIQSIKDKTHAVVLYSKKNTPCGGGLVTVGGNGALLWSGCVSQRYRSRGYWRTLVGARQMISSQQGAQLWITTTANPRIAGKGDGAYKVLGFRKVKQSNSH